MLKGAPQEVITRLNGAVVDALADAEVRKRLADLGMRVVPRELQTPEALRAFQKARGGRSSRRRASRLSEPRSTASRR
jgi:tripartite-type tricarboxylate transporter receptor subunit TctC